MALRKPEVQVMEAGDKFNEWTVLVVQPRKSLCRCSCGTEKEVHNYHLKSGASPRCRECHHNDRHYGGRDLGVDRRVWRRLRVAANDAVARCTNPKHKVFGDYGGRGIRVFQEWVNDKIAFARYLATLAGHDDRSLWLDRIDNEMGYEPGNLRFVTVQTSNLNKRRRKRIPGSTRWKRDQ
jgi:hypothetical protein